MAVTPGMTYPKVYSSAAGVTFRVWDLGLRVEACRFRV